MRTKVNITGTTDKDRCELCGKIDELRPYGSDGESICFDCGMKDTGKTGVMFEMRMSQGSIEVEDVFCKSRRM